jgi:hypothetical protein
VSLNEAVYAEPICVAGIVGGAERFKVPLAVRVAEFGNPGAALRAARR